MELVSCIPIKTLHTEVFVPVADITYFKADKKYVHIFAKTGTHKVEDSLDRLEQQFGSLFVRTHRKYLVRLSVIRAMIRVGVGKFLEVDGVAERIPVSRREAAAVRAKLRSQVSS